MCRVQVTWHTLCTARKKGGSFAAAVATDGISHFDVVIATMVIEPDSHPSLYPMQFLTLVLRVRMVVLLTTPLARRTPPPWAHASALHPSAQVTDDHHEVSRRQHEKKVRRTSRLLGAEVAKKLGEMV